MVIEVARDIFIPLGQAGADAFDDSRNWIDSRGYRLSDRLWSARQADRAAIDGILRSAILAGDDPLVVARRLEDYLLPAGRPVRDPKTGRLVRWKKDEAGNLLRDASGKLIPAQGKGVITRTPRSGAGSYAARRLARTEVTRAFGQATIQAATLNPFTEGVQWVLSGSHGKPDECDDNARGHSRGLPAGVYHPNEVPRFPNHPHDRCVLIPYTTRTPDDVVAQLRRDFDLDRADKAASEPTPLFPTIGNERPAAAKQTSGLGRMRDLTTTLFRVARQFLMRGAA